MASPSPLGSVAATFATADAAEAAIEALARAGFGEQELSAVIQSQRIRRSGGLTTLGTRLERVAVAFDYAPVESPPLQRWSGIGAGVGAVLGIALVASNLGLGGLPGLSLGMLLGMLVGGALGALGSMGEKRLEYYLSERVRRRLAQGGVVVTVLAEYYRLQLARDLLEQAGGHEVRILGP